MALSSAARSKKWRLLNRHWVGEHKNTEIARRYGMSHLDYLVMLEKQKFGCAICDSKVPGGRGKFHIDHDHVTGEVRGLLCNDCNLAIGKFKDSANLLRRAVAYVERLKEDM